MKKKIHGRVSCHFLGRSRLDDFNKARVHMRTRALVCGELREIALDALVQRSQRSASEGSTQTSNQYSILQIFIRRCFTIVARCCGRPYHPGDGHHFDRRKVTHLAVLRTKCWQMCVWGTGRYILMQRSDEGVITVWRRAKEVLLLRSRRFHCRGFYCLFFFFRTARRISFVPTVVLLLNTDPSLSTPLSSPEWQTECIYCSIFTAYFVIDCCLEISTKALVIDWLIEWLIVDSGGQQRWLVLQPNNSHGGLKVSEVRFRLGYQKRRWRKEINSEQMNKKWLKINLPSGCKQKRNWLFVFLYHVLLSSSAA